jgi:acetylornithine deacetylase
MKEPCDVVALARELVAVPSVTGDEGGVAQLVAERLEKNLWHVTRQEVPPEVPGGPARYNILAVDDPALEPQLVLTTHLDTVPPFIAPTEDDEHLYGRGTCDAKGIFAAQWMAVERLRAAGKKGIALLGVAGEETDSVGAKIAHVMLPRARFVVDGEPTDLMMTSGAKGILALRVTAKGIAGHSAYPEQGISAAHAMIRGLARLVDAKLPGSEKFGDSTVNVGVLNSGLAPNVIAPAASASVLIRLAAPIEAVLAEVRRALGPDLEVEITSASDPLDMHVPEGHASRVVRFGSDVPYLAKIGTCLLVGPGSILDAHTKGEFVKKKDLETSVELYCSIAEGLFA